MPKKLTFEFVQKYFKEQSCELLEIEYINSKTKMKYLCECGNTSEITFKNFKKGHRCMKCSGTPKYTYKYIKQFFKERNCELLETEYINTDTKMKYLCECGNESVIIFDSFKRGTRCKKCSGYEKLTFEFVQNKFKEQECKLLEIEYINAKTKMKYCCSCGNNSEITYSNFKQGQRCMKCSGLEKHTFEDVKNYFNEQSCELLETEYINFKTKMKYRCSCSNDSYITFGNFKSGQRCAKCYGNEKHTFEYVLNYFKKQNCELLETEYKNMSTKIKYICNCDNESSITFSDFKNGVRCGKCYGNEKLTFEYVFNFFKKENCELLETEYINSKTKMKYICNCKNESEIRFSTFQNGSRCGKCKNKTEEIVYSFFKNKYIITHQAKFDWCKNINHLPFDFLFDDYKILLEIDGRQHFEQVSNWQSPEESLERDIFKMKLALKNNYSIIRIFQEDIFYNNINWQDKIINSIKHYDDPSIIYISKNLNLYDNYKIAQATEGN